IGIVATSDKAWAPFSGTLPSEFFEDTDNAILEENEEENVINYVHIVCLLLWIHMVFHKHVKVLDSLSNEVIEASSLCFFSLKLLLNKDKRTMFLSINPKIIVWWLKTEMEESSKFSSLLRS
ncbi:hypothetical protein Gohar_015673, partial [Gossypium harknessii]|nr:hypothetical protein [Gossypium harknessii]